MGMGYGHGVGRWGKEMGSGVWNEVCTWDMGMGYGDEIWGWDMGMGDGNGDGDSMEMG